jgi:hypothetical protein
MQDGTKIEILGILVFVTEGLDLALLGPEKTALDDAYPSEPAALTETEIGGTLENILSDATRGKVKSSAQYLKTGGFDQPNADFDELTQGVKVTDQGEGIRSATLSNGTKVSVRPSSSGGQPTLTVRTSGNLPIKVRY